MKMLLGGCKGISTAKEGAELQNDAQKQFELETRRLKWSLFDVDIFFTNFSFGAIFVPKLRYHARIDNQYN